MKDRVEVYKDVGQGWRWRIVAPNGEIIAVAGEAFTRRWSAWRAARRALRSQ